MDSSFNNKTKDNSGAAVSLNALRGQAMMRLTGIHQKLDSKGISAVFTRSAKADPLGDMGFMGSLILGMMTFGSFSAFSVPHVADAFNGVSVAACMEGISLLSDQKASGYRARKLNDYPEGRRTCALEAARIGKKFKLVSANQNNHFSYDTQADLACMFEILDLLDKLESEGVSMMRLDQKKPVYEVLKKIGKKMFGKGAVRTYAAGMMRAA